MCALVCSHFPRDVHVGVVDAEVVLGGAATDGGPNEEEGEALGGASDSCTCRTVDLL